MYIRIMDAIIRKEDIAYAVRVNGNIVSIKLVNNDNINTQFESEDAAKACVQFLADQVLDVAISVTDNTEKKDDKQNNVE